jgi:hypothetical protein
MKEAIVTVVETQEYDDGMGTVTNVTFSTVYRVEFEGDVEYDDDRSPDFMLQRVVACEKLTAK